MKSSLYDTLAAPVWARPSARLARPLSLALRALVLALLAVFACGAFAPRADAASNPTVYSFSSTTDGNNPEAPPVTDSSGNLWGTTYKGGSHGLGTVWELVKQAQTSGVTPPPATKELIYSFAGGTTDGSNPVGGLVLGTDGNLYGATSTGGTYGYGTFFKVVPSTGVLTIVYSVYQNLSDNSNTPSGTPVQDPNNGNFYIPCQAGGSGYGAILEVNPTVIGINSYVKYIGLGGSTAPARFPYGQLTVEQVSGTYYLFGTSATTRSSTGGCVFAIGDALTTATYSTLTTFAAGVSAVSGLIHGVGADTNLYGATLNGGANLTGNVFKVTTAGVYTDIGDFAAISTTTPTNTTGAYPQGRLAISASGTTLYGTTSAGGSAGTYTTASSGSIPGHLYSGGTTFSCSTTGTAGTPPTVLTSLKGTSGDSLNSYTTYDTSTYGYFTPYGANGLYTTAGLNFGIDGYLYGAGLMGGTGNYGTVFRLGPPQTYNYTFFVTGASASLSLAIDDYMTGITDNYTINAPAHGALTPTPLTGSVVSAATAPTVTKTYTPSSVGTDSFTYTASNPVFGASATGATAYGNVSLYDGTITATASPTTVTTKTTVLSAGGTFPAAGDTTLTYTWAATTVPTGGTVAFTGSTNGTNAAKSGVTATFNKAGSYTFTLTVTAPDGTIYTPAPTVTVTVNTTVAAFTVSPSSASVGNGGTQQFTASPVDQFNNPVAVTWSVSGPAGTTISATGLLTAGGTAGTGTVTALAGGTTATASITVTVPTFTVGTPTATASGAVVTLNEIASTSPASTISYAWSLVSGAGTVTAWTGQNAATATATVSAPGAYTFQVVVGAPGFSSVTKSVSITLTAMPASITITPTSLTAYPGGPSNTFTAVVKDQFGNTLSGQTVNWAVGGAAKGSISTSGVYTVPASVTTTGTDTVTATLGSVTSNTATVTIAQGTVTCSASANPTTVTGTTTTLTSVGTWTGGPSSYLTYTIVQQSGPTGATLSNPNNTNSAANETITFTKSGTYKIYVVAYSPNGQASGQSATITITVTLPPTLSEPAGVIGINQQFDPAVTTDSFGYVEGTDTDTDGDTQAYLQANTSYTGSSTFQWTYTGPTGVTFDPTYNANVYDPTVTFTKPGTYVFTCTITGGGTTLTTSVTYILVSVGTNLTIAPAGPLYIGKGTTQQFTVTGETDQFGSSITPSSSITWYAFNGTISATGLYTATTAGSGFNSDAVYAVDNANPSGSTSNTVTVNVYNPAPTVATEISGTTSTGTDTATTTTATSNLSVLGQWIANPGLYNLGESNLTYTWSTFGTQPGTVNFSVNGTNAAKNTVATFGAAGIYYIYVTIKAPNNKTVQDPPSGTYLVVTVSQTLTTIKITPSSATMTVGGTQNFNATGYDQFGNAMSTQPTFTWSTNLGTVDATGLYTGTTPGTATVTAKSGSISGTATVTVNDAAPVLSAITVNPNPVTGTSAALSVTGNYSGPGNLTYVWSEVSGPASVTFSGGTSAMPGSQVTTTALFTASGTYKVQVVATDTQGLSSTPATVTFTVNSTFAALKCSPNPVTVTIGGTQQFSAIAYDQFGVALTSQPTITWSVANSGGAVSTIGTAGLLTAGNVPGSAVVTASATVSGATHTDTSAVTIGDAAPTLGSITVNPNPVTGTTATFTVTGTYAGTGNLTYVWSASGPQTVTFSGGTSGSSGTAVTATGTFVGIGSYTVKVVVSDTSGTTASQTVFFTVDATESKILIMPNPASVALNGTVTLGATAYDQFGVALGTQPAFTWVMAGPTTYGTINGSGTFTATGTPGTALVKVIGASVSAQGQVQVINQPPTIASGPTANPNPVVSTTTSSLSVLGAYVGTGGEGSLTYTWSAVAGPSTPSFSPNGTNAAKNATVTFGESGTYTLRVTITDTAGGTTSGDVTVVVNETITTVKVTPGPTDTETIGTGTQTYIATGYSQFGTPLKSPATFTWSNTGPGSVNGSGVYTITTPGTATITATSGGVSGQTVVTINDVAPTVGTAASATPNPVFGTTTNLSVLGQYTNGESGLTYTWVASPSAGVTFSANGTNAAKNTTATFTTAGNYTFTVTINDGYGGTATSSVMVTVSQLATTITVTPNPVNVAILASQTFTATAKDQFGNAISSPTFTWSVKNGFGTITSSGVYTASSTPNTETVEASYGGATGDATVNVTDANPTVGSITVNPNPVTGTTATFTATGSYVGGGNLTYAWSTTGTPPAPVTFSGGTSGAAGSPVTATGTFTKAGTYTVLVTVSDAYSGVVTQTVTFTVNQTSTAITVSPNPASVTDGTTQQFGASVTDQFGDPLTSQPTFTWSVTSGSGSINSSGLYTAPNTPGSSVVTVTGGGQTGTVSITNVDAPPTVATAASASPNPVTTGTTTSLSVLGAYVGGESSLTYTWSATSVPTGGAVTFSANGTNAAKNTVATFTAPGTYVLSVEIDDAFGGSVTSSVSVEVDDANGPVVISPSPGAAAVGGTLQLSAVQNDQFGNALIPQPTFTWSLTSGGGSVNTSGLFTAPGSPGTSVVKVTSSNGQSASVTITTGDVAPTITTAASASPNPVTAKTTTLTVTASYPGNTSSLTYTWSYTGPSGVTYTGSNGTNGASSLQANFTQAGTYAFTVTVANTTGQSVTSTVNVTVSQTLTNVVVTPSTASIAIGGTQQFTATAYDQFGNALTSQPAFTWTVPTGTGTVNANGLYAATLTPGSATVKATTGSFSDTGAVTVTDTPVTVATAASASPNPVTGTTTSLSVLGAWNGGESNLTYAWTVSGPGSVTFSANGTNGAKNTTATFTKPGSYTFTVTITDGYGGSAISTVNVTVNTATNSLTISPTTATINVGGTKQFTATATDQFGTALSPQPTFTWTVTAGPGSVSSSGLYTASAAAGTATVQVSAGGQSATATVTVNDVAPTVATAASASPNPVTGTTTTLSVLGAYAGGESNLTYTWSVTSGPAAVTYSANGTNGAKSTVATFMQAGSYTFLVTITTPGGLTATSTVNVTVKQTAGSFAVSPSTATLSVNGQLQISSVTIDQFGNAVTPAPTVTWTITSGGGSVNPNGLFTAPSTSGTTVVKGTSGSFSGTCTITINDGAPTVATPASATPNPVTAKTTNLSVLGAYVGGESTLTYTWSATGPAAVTYSINGTNAAKNTVATFTKAGSYVFTVTITTPSNLTTTSTVNVTVNQTPTSVTVTPNPASIAVGGTVQFNATSIDQFGAAISPAPTFTWSVASGGGSISSGGLYTAPGTTGTATVKATAGAASGTATVNIVAAGTLNGTVSTSSAAVNLTTQGTLDWDHWGRGVPGLDQKSGGSLISGYTAVGAGTIGAYRTDKRPLSWTNGTPTVSSTNNITGVYSGGQGSGFQIKSPASSTTRTLVVYVGGNGAGGTLTATMSDGSTTTYTNSQPTQTGLWDAEYTFTYSTGTAGATLNVTWVQSTPGNGSVTLSAATLH